MGHNMICPACGKEMEPGRVYSRTALFWSPKPDKIWRAAGREDIVLSSPAEYPAAQICKDCRKVIIDY